MKKILLVVLLVSTFISCKKVPTSAAAGAGPTPANNSPQYGTPFTGVPDPKDIIMYEVNIRAFSSTDNFAGVEARLDSIRALGVNVIWLMPTYPVGPDNSPYCVQNYFQVNTEFGNLADLRDFVSMAHTKGMAVILDWVTDGTSFNSLWLQQGDSSWYLRTPSGAIQANPSYSDIAALNYANSTMEQALVQGMQYWLLNANVDGFRCDNADNDPESFWTLAIDSVKQMGHKLILLAESNNTNKFASGFQMDYAWDYFNALQKVFGPAAASADTLINANAAENAGTPAGTYMLRFTTNHDADRSPGTPLQLFGGISGSLAAFVLTATMGGVPLIYDGQEVACPLSLDIFNTSTIIDWTANTSVSGAYEQIIAFRNNNDAVKEGAITSLGSSNIAAFQKTVTGDTVLVIVNVRNTTQSYTIPATLQNTTWQDALSSNAILTLNTTRSLSPYQYLLLKKQ